MSKRMTSTQNADLRKKPAENTAKDSFKEENPFYSLDISRFPPKKSVTAREPRVSQKRLKLTDDMSQDENSFAELMHLSGVETLPPKGVVPPKKAEKQIPEPESHLKKQQCPTKYGAPQHQDAHHTCKSTQGDAQLRQIMNAIPEKSVANRGKADTNHDENSVFSALENARGFEALKNAKPGQKKRRTEPTTEPKADKISQEQIKPGKSTKNIKDRNSTISPTWLDRTTDTHDKENVEDDELALFAQAVGSVEPMASKGRDIPVVLPKKNGPGEASDIQALQDLVDGKIEFAMEMTEEYIEGHVIGLDQLVIAKMRAGNYHPEAHLDMHGLNANQAYERLVGFMRGAYYKGFRCVLVIPGRGKNSPDGMGVLRERLQLWLTQEPFKRVVLGFCTAQAIHGGPGTLYVLLRKYKKNRGKIHWDRLPMDPDLY